MKILCLGSLNLDFVYKVDHFVAPGETIAALERNQHCGGKGLNQAIALARAGATVYHAGKIGSDGEILRERLVGSGVNDSLLETDTTVPTGHAIIQVDPSGQNNIIICGGANRSIDKSFVDRVLENFTAGDILLLQNEISEVDYAISRAAEKGMTVALNPSPLDEALKNSPELKKVGIFILNEIEGFDLTGEKEPTAICKKLKSLYPDCVVMLTLGSRGSMYFDGESTYTHDIFKVNAVDTTGAGDTFTGYFLAGLAEGMDVASILELASKASAIAVSRPGASDSIPTRKEVETTEL